MSKEMTEFLEALRLPEKPLDKAWALSQAVHERLSYIPGSTGVETAGGLLVRYADPGDHIKGGALLGRIENPCDGETLEELRAQRDGIVFFAHHANLINGHEVAFRVVPD
jgi:predicted deacylase